MLDGGNWLIRARSQLSLLLKGENQNDKSTPESVLDINLSCGRDHILHQFINVTCIVTVYLKHLQFSS